MHHIIWQQVRRKSELETSLTFPLASENISLSQEWLYYLKYEIFQKYGWYIQKWLDLYLPFQDGGRLYDVITTEY